jgi:hypothetical protein
MNSSALVDRMVGFVQDIAAELAANTRSVTIPRR